MKPPKNYRVVMLGGDGSGVTYDSLLIKSQTDRMKAIDEICDLIKYKKKSK